MLEREAMAVLVGARGIHYGHRETALQQAGSALAILAEPAAYAGALTQEGAAEIARLLRTGEAERMLDTLREKQVHLLMRGDAQYPQRLAHIPRPPHLLHVWGRADLDDPCPIAVVGTRRASEYGLQMTRAISRELAGNGVCIVSGLAQGIDAAGHRGALDASGRTVAVLGGALDKLYPEENRMLMHAILGSGGSVVSEYAMGCPPSRYSFLHRNRIIAGMSLGVLVTEGAAHSGALRTANDALDCGREVFALPGDVRSEGSQLPHMLISEGAHLITCARDILNMLSEQRDQGETTAQRARPAKPRRAGEEAEETLKGEQDAEAGEKSRAKRKMAKQDANRAAPAREGIAETAGRRTPDGLDAQQQAVWQALCAGERDFDEIAQQTQIDAQELGALLMMMEMDGLIDALAGLRYRLA